MAIRGLAEELRVVYPKKRLVISTVTGTGNKVAQSIAREFDFISYLPLDFGLIVKSVIDKINPALFIIAETELWPNLISYLFKKNIPLVVVNARISDNSFRGYRWIKFLTKSILNKVNLFCVQTSLDAERLKFLGVAEGKIKITGNMKFDLKADSKNDLTDQRLKLGITIQEKLLVAASTHPGEEEMVLNTYKDLLREFASLRLLIAPRHPERTAEVASLIKKFGFAAQRISLLNLRTYELANLRTIFVLDTVGQLLSFYNIADIVFVGGSLVKTGGHNILEPASLGKPVLFGPYMFNFRDIADLFLKNKAAILVSDQEALKTKIKSLLYSPLEAAELGRRARELIQQNQGATKSNTQLIKESFVF